MNTIRQELRQGFATERSFIKSCLPSTMGLRSHFVALLAERVKALPSHWPTCDHFFVALLPSFEKDVALFHAYPNKPSLTDILKPHQIDHLDRDISNTLSLLVHVAKQKSREKRKNTPKEVHAEQSLSCALCGTALLNNTQLLQHLRAQHQTTPAKYYDTHPTATKACSVCHRVLSVQHFLRDRSNNYGYRTRCLYCMRPDNVTIACPVCRRVVSAKAIIGHMWTEHLIHPEDAYKKHLKQKYCPRCGEFKTLDEFYPVKHPAKLYQTYCKRCSQDRYKLVMKTMVVRASGKTHGDVGINDLFALIADIEKLVRADIATPLSTETDNATVRQMNLGI